MPARAGDLNLTGAGIMDYEFPFDVPEDISTLNKAETYALFTQVRDHGRELKADENASLEALQATGELFTKVKERRDAFAAAEKSAEAFDADDDPDEPEDDSTDDSTDDAGDDADDTDGDDDADDKNLTANEGRGTPTLKKVKGKTPKASSQTPESVEQAYATMTVATDVPNKTSGAKLNNFSEAAEAVSERIDQYSAPDRPAPNRKFRRAQRKAWRSKRNNIVHSTSERAEIMVQHPEGHTHTLTDYARHGAVRFRRQYPDDQRLLIDDEPYDKVLQIADEKRLPGGNLMESAKLAVEGGKSLTAAVGWCAPSETLYQLCELESMDGILDIPEMQADRGGFNIPEDGGIDFSTIWNGIGNAGDTHLSEYDVENDTAKVCWEIPCPDFIDTRLGVDYVCLTAGLLQRAGYPEVIRRVTRGAMVALAHKINQGVIADMVTAAGAATVIPSDPGGDDAASALLAAVELAVMDARYRHRMPFSQTLEIVLPFWVYAVIRAALSRRSGVNLLGVTDAQILEWFRIRGAMPRFVYDWQDALSGLVGGPGGAAPITEFPSTVDFLAYPAGTFTKAVQPVVNLDTIYDSSGLTQNQYTALFAEDGWAVLQTCPEAQLYTAPVDVSGCVGCIAAGTS